jgi:hypothetical protein
MANEIGVQRKASVKKVQQKEQEIRQAIESSRNLRAKGAALREAVFAASRGESVTVPTENNPVYPLWYAEDNIYEHADIGIKNIIYRMADGNKVDVLVCPHRHRTTDAARACARKAVKARNSSRAPVMDGWTAWIPSAEPWTKERVRAIVGEVTDSYPKG